MDVGPIVKVFTALLTAGAAVSLMATAFSCKVVAGLVGSALGAPGTDASTTAALALQVLT